MARKQYIEVKDDNGRVVGRIVRNKSGAQLNMLGDSGQFIPWGSIGGDFWEWMHPGQVQAEYEAVGKNAPSTGDITSGAFDDAVSQASDAVQRAQANIASGVQAIPSIGKWVVIGLVAYALIQVMQVVPKRH